ncbi:MAG: hypothetical protein OHK93_007527 [Ramalina farinacea]|uniref:F-box domain-containing protein n=1 Tax=Ramalina farinacea TaxID=258253 RepID=A0AA43TU57_9LECA|nr:hypothetical protein [Ramalina farinacea]
MSQSHTTQDGEAGKKPKYMAIRPRQTLPCESPQSRRMSIDYLLEQVMDVPTIRGNCIMPSSSNENLDPSIERRTASAVTCSTEVPQAASKDPARHEDRDQGVMIFGASAATSPLQALRPRRISPAIQKLPNEILRDIFRCLLVSAVNIAPITKKKREIHLNVLFTCKQFYQIAWPILYSENTFIEVLTDDPKPVKSIFDLMPTRGIMMITKLAFLITDEGYRLDGLALLAKRIQILTKLRLLWIFLPERMDPLIYEHPTVGEQHDRMVAVLNRKRVRFEKQSIIETDKKALKDMVWRLKSLKRIWLVGFEDEEWAKKLERAVSVEATLFPSKVDLREMRLLGRHSNET